MGIATKQILRVDNISLAYPMEALHVIVLVKSCQDLNIVFMFEKHQRLTVRKGPSTTKSPHMRGAMKQTLPQDICYE